ncbi:MAG: cysteine desulfurase family protein [Candidatus Saccharibacteria bacterium]|nr:cysteine desulfurase family protein [Candidatus Saccharibacteria bacterium]
MIYLDHAAATPVSKKVFEAMRPYFSDDFFNPSSAYLPAKKVASEYEAAKNTIARAIGAKGSDLIITAGATEANNLAFSAIEASKSNLSTLEPTRPPVFTGGSFCRRRLDDGEHALESDKLLSTRILYLETEHDSVRKVAEKLGGAKVKVLKSGLVDQDDLRKKITDETEFISISLANNELGVIQPLAEIGAMIREIKIDRLRRGVKKPLLLHSDASQALNLLDINVARLGVDLLTLNAAKVYGPKGVGALYVSHEVRLSPLTVGGGQENGLRSGTENVAGVIGFAKAVSEAKEHLNGNRKKYSELKKAFLENLENYELVNKKHSLDNFVVLCYNGLDAERLVFLLEEKEVYVATGAACAASKGVRSHVLAAIGLSDPEINGSLRITFGETNTKEQIIKAAQIINQVVADEKERMRNG